MSAFALGWTLIHSLWQGALVALALAAVLAVVDRRAALLRYGVSCGALALLALLPVVTLLQVRAPSEPSVVVLPAGVGPAGVVRIEEPGAPDLPHRFATALTPALPWIVASWMAGVLAFSIRLAGGWLRVRRLVSVGVRSAPGPAREALRRLAGALDLRRTVRLLESARVRSPMVIGWIRPVVLVPPAALFGLDPAQLEAILAHELAHVRRHDYLVNVLQSMVETVLFYHPAAWWISRRVRVEREHCCDDVGSAVCGDPLLYARALVRLEELRRPAQGLAVAAAGSPGEASLLARVRRLLEPAEVEGAGARGGAAALVSGFLAAVLLVGTLTGILTGVLTGVLTGTEAAEAMERLVEDAPSPAASPEPSPLAGFSPEERVLLARYSVAAAYVRSLAGVGLSGLTADELVTLSRYGVDAAYVAALDRLGYRDLRPHQLATLRRYSVDPAWVERLQEAGHGKVPMDTLVTLRRYGVAGARP